MLLRADRRPWGPDPSSEYRYYVRGIVQEIGLDPKTSMYSLRHASIIQKILANVPLRLIAVLHNTSTAQIESNYSKFIDQYVDAHRVGLLEYPV